MFKKTLSILITIMLMATSSFAAIEYEREEDARIYDERVTFIVEVEGDPLLLGTDARNIGAQEYIGTRSSFYAEERIIENQAQIYSAIENSVSQDAQLGYIYTSLFNGFSVECESDKIDEIKAIPGVKNVFISEEIHLPETMMKYADGIGGITEYPDLGYDGEGQVIAIVDAGCYTDHEFFKTAPENPKYAMADIDALLKAHTTNCGITDGSKVYKSEKIPFAYNYNAKTTDTHLKNNHGTHVSGIAAGKNGTYLDGTKFSGVAPEAQLMIFGALNENGSGALADLLAGVNDAAILGADVINMSFGTDYLGSDVRTVYKRIVENAANAGISIYAAAGNASRGFNEGKILTTRPDYSAIGIPADESVATAVASADNTSFMQKSAPFALPDGTEMKFEELFAGADFDKLFEEGEYLPYVYCGVGYTSSFEGKDITGKIALVKRGSVALATIVTRAANRGAVGVILINNTASPAITSTCAIPTAVARVEDESTLKNATDKRITCIGESTLQTVTPQSGGKISSYSSWGIGSRLDLKPEIAAPGGNIYSSSSDGKYMYNSGTSMASPYMAGMGAVTRQYYATNPFAEAYNGLTGRAKTSLIENIQMNSAGIIYQDNGVPYSPRLQGAGLVNGENILKTPVLLTGDSGKAKINLKEIGSTFTVAFEITNISKDAVTFDDISIEVLTDGHKESGGKYYIAGTERIAHTVTLPKEITLLPGEKYSFSEEVKLDESAVSQKQTFFPNGFFVDGYVILNSTAKETEVSIPFAGYHGDWSGLDIFDSTSYDEGGSTLLNSGEEFYYGTYLSLIDKDDYLFPMGKNYWYRTAVSEDYIAYSPDWVGSLGVVLTNLRSAQDVTVTIYDSDGELVFTQNTGEDVAKFGRTFVEFKRSNFDALEDGDYTIKVSASDTLDTSITDSMELSFAVDSTAPVIVSAVLDETQKQVTVTATDERYLANLYLQYTNSSGTRSQLTATSGATPVKGQQYYANFDISGAATLDDIVIGCADFAYNETSRDLSFYTEDVSAICEDIYTSGGVSLVTFAVRNNLKEEKDIKLILGFYKENGEFLFCSTKEEKYKAGAEKKPVFIIEKNISSAEKLSLFKWEKGTLVPLAVPLETPLK